MYFLSFLILQIIWVSCPFLFFLQLLALLLGALRDAPAAATQLKNHLDMLRAVPLTNAPASLLSNHFGWIAQQYTTAAKLVTSCGIPLSSFPPSMLLRPAQLYVEAFHAASTRRRILQKVSDKDGGSFVGLSNKEESVKPGRYLGQIEINSNSNPGDEQVETWLEMEELESLDTPISGGKGESTSSCLYLLKAAKKAAIEASKNTTSSSGSVSPCTKLLASIDTTLGEELLYYSGDCTAAKHVLSTAAEQYRKDRWSGPLYRVLMALRECAGREKNTAEHVTLSLEAAATVASSSTTDVDTNVVDMAQAAVEDLTSTKLDYSAEFITESETAPWAKIVKITAAGFSKRSFAEQNSTQSDRCDVFEVQLQNNAPVDIPFLSASVLFEDSHGNFEVELKTKLGSSSSSPRNSTSTSATTSDTINVLPGTVYRRSNKEATSTELVCRFFSGRKSSPWIAASQLKLDLSSTISIIYSLPAAMSLLQTPEMGEAAVKRPPSLRINVAPARYAVPSIALLVPDKGFIGESLPARVSIMTRETQEKVQSTDSGGGVLVFKKCRLVVSASVAGKATAILFSKNSEQQQQQSKEDTLEFDVEDLPSTQNNHTTVEIEFGFSVQAPVEETIKFSARLHYALLGENEQEIGAVDVNAAVPVLLPFECDVVVTPTTVVQTVPHSRSGSSSSSIIDTTPRSYNPSTRIAGPVYVLESSPSSSTITNTSSAGVGDDVRTASLRSLSVQDAQLRQKLAPRLPLQFTLPVAVGGISPFGSAAQWCAAVNVYKVKPPGGEWKNDAEVDALNIRHVCIDTTVGEEASLNVVPLRKDSNTLLAALKTPGDICCAAFQITQRQKKKKNEGKNTDGFKYPSLGNLIIKWQRSSRIPLVPHYASSSSSSFPMSSPSNPSSSSDSFTKDKGVYTATLEGLQDGKVVIPLSPVLLTSPSITAQAFYPPTATAGEAITLEVEIRFPGKDALRSREVEVVVGEPYGFLIAGPRATTLSQVPSGGGESGGGTGKGNEFSRISLCLVPYHVGYLKLPEIKVSVYGHEEIQVTQGCIVFVKPAIVDGAADASE